MLFHISGNKWADTDDLSQSDYYCFCKIRDAYEKASEDFRKSQSREDLRRMNELNTLLKRVADGRIKDVINNKKYRELVE